MYSSAQTIKRFVYVAIAISLCFFICSLSTGFARAEISAELTQAFEYEGEVVPGALVSIAEGDGKKVEVADKASGEKLIGVMVTPNQSTIAVSTSDNTVQVATSGKTVALVSNINGDIVAGDVLGLSSIKGVASKAVPGSRIVGVADSSFNKKTAGVATREVKDSSGNGHLIAIGSIPITISIGSQMPVEGTGRGEDVLGWVSALVGEKVTGARFALAGVVAVIMVVATSVMLYGSVRNTIYGVSRNPLAKASIFEALGEVVMMVVGIAIIGTVLIYVILKI